MWQKNMHESVPALFTNGVFHRLVPVTAGEAIDAVCVMGGQVNLEFRASLSKS